MKLPAIRLQSPAVNRLQGHVADSSVPALKGGPTAEPSWKLVAKAGSW